MAKVRFMPDETQALYEHLWNGIAFKSGQGITVRDERLLSGKMPDGFVVERSGDETLANKATVQRRKRGSDPVSA